MLKLFNKKGKMFEHIYYAEGPWNTSKVNPLYYVEKYDIKYEAFRGNEFLPWMTEDELDQVDDGMVVYV